jgi:hypothetical protein
VSMLPPTSNSKRSIIRTTQFPKAKQSPQSISPTLRSQSQQEPMPAARA